MRRLIHFILTSQRHSTVPDAELLRQYLATKNEAAFAQLLHRYGPLVWRVCQQAIPNHADAEDAFQATFLALAQSAKSIRDPATLPSWLHGAALRVCGKLKRSHNRRKQHEQQAVLRTTDNGLSVGEWQQLLQGFHGAIAKLPMQQRTAVILCDLEGMQATTAAERLGVSLTTFNSTLCRARKRLLQQVKEHGLFVGLTGAGTALVLPSTLMKQTLAGLSGPVSKTISLLIAELTMWKMIKLKTLAVASVVACSVTLGGYGWVAVADGQTAGPGGMGGPASAPAAPAAMGGGIPGMMGNGLGAPAPQLKANLPYLYVGKPKSLVLFKQLLDQKTGMGYDLLMETSFELNTDIDVLLTSTEDRKAIENIDATTKVVLIFKKCATSTDSQVAVASQPKADNEEYQVVRLEHAKAADVNDAYMKWNKSWTKYASNYIRIVAEHPSNSVVLIGKSAGIADVKDFLRQYDVPANASNAKIAANTKIEKVKLKNIAAVTTADLLATHARFFAKLEEEKTLKITAEPISNTLLLSGNSSDVAKLVEFLRGYDVPANASPVAPAKPLTFTLQFVKAEDAEGMSEFITKRYVKPEEPRKPGMSLVHQPGSKALAITTQDHSFGVELMRMALEKYPGTTIEKVQ